MYLGPLQIFNQILELVKIFKYPDLFDQLADCSIYIKTSL